MRISETDHDERDGSKAAADAERFALACRDEHCG